MDIPSTDDTANAKLQTSTWNHSKWHERNTDFGQNKEINKIALEKHIELFLKC